MCCSFVSSTHLTRETCVVSVWCHVSVVSGDWCHMSRVSCVSGLRCHLTRTTQRGPADMTCTRHAGQHTKLEDHIPRRSSLDPLVHAARVIRAWSPYPRPLLPPRLVRPFTQGSTPHNRAPTAFWPCAFHVASPSTRRLCEARQKRMRQSLAQWPKRRQRWH